MNFLNNKCSSLRNTYLYRPYTVRLVFSNEGKGGGACFAISILVIFPQYRIWYINRFLSQLRLVLFFTG